MSGGGGQKVQFALRKIETYEDYQSALDFDADASASYGLFHGSAKFNYAEKHKFKSFSRYLVASVVVTNAFRKLQNVQLTDSARALLEQGNTDRFNEEFGNTFVLGIATGGVYYAVLEFTAETQEDLTDISAHLDVGEYGVFSGEASFSSRMQQFKGHTSLSVDSFQLGGTDTRQSISVDDIIAKATNFPLDVKQVAVPFTAFLQDYKTLDLPAGPNIVDIENTREVLQQYLRLRNQLVQKLNEIEYIQQYPDQFVNPDLNSLPQWHTEVANLLNQVTRGASACVNNPTACKFTELSVPTFTLPALKPGVKRTEAQQIQVPDLWNQTKDHAVELLGVLGLNVTCSDSIAMVQFLGCVVGQTPAAGTMVDPGSTIHLEVGSDNHLPLPGPLHLGGIPH